MDTNGEHAVPGFSGFIDGDGVTDLEEFIVQLAHLASSDGKGCFGKRAYAHHAETYPMTKRLKKLHMVWVWALGWRLYAVYPSVAVASKVTDRVLGAAATDRTTLSVPSGSRSRATIYVRLMHHPCTRALPRSYWNSALSVVTVSLQESLWHERA